MRLVIVHGHERAGQDLRSPPALAQSPVDRVRAQAFAFELVQHLGRALDHADHVEVLPGLADDGGHAEPAVHEQVFCLNSGGQGAFEHRLDQLGGLADRLFASLGPTGSAVELLGDALVAVFLLGG